MDLEELNVENALKLTKAFHRNKSLEQFEYVIYLFLKSLL
jgi:hypothetical protein